MNHGYIDIGYVKTTPFQKKKHITQMSKKEEAYLRKCLSDMIYKLEFSKHLENKRRKGKLLFSKNNINDMIVSDEYDIIEYNETWVDNHTTLSRRVLIRGNNVEDVHAYTPIGTLHMLCNLCAVIDFERGKIVTAYWNAADDNHDTLDFNRYDKNLQIIKK